MNNLITTQCSDDELLFQLGRACASSRRLTAKIVALLVQVEERRLHLAHAIPSMFEFCVRRLQMSEGEAFRRITAARLAARFPSVIARLASGALTLSNLCALRDHLDEENVEELLEAVRGKSKMEVLELLAARSPRPDAPSRLRKLPTVRTGASVQAVPAAVVEPLAESRYRLQVTLSRASRDKLEYARDLMRHRNLGGDLAVVIDRALDALLVQLEKEILGKTSRKEPAKPPLAKAAPKAPPAGRCTYESKSGKRCTMRTHLVAEPGEPSSTGVRCRADARAEDEPQRKSRSSSKRRSA